MKKYYTRACNFFYGEASRHNLKKKLSLPLNGSKNISFDNLFLPKFVKVMPVDYRRALVEIEKQKLELVK